MTEEQFTHIAEKTEGFNASDVCNLINDAK